MCIAFGTLEILSKKKRPDAFGAFGAIQCLAKRAFLSPRHLKSWHSRPRCSKERARIETICRTWRRTRVGTKSSTSTKNITKTNTFAKIDTNQVNPYDASHFWITTTLLPTVWEKRFFLIANTVSTDFTYIMNSAPIPQPLPADISNCLLRLQVVSM